MIGSRIAHPAIVDFIRGEPSSPLDKSHRQANRDVRWRTSRWTTGPTGGRDASARPQSSMFDAPGGASGRGTVCNCV